MPPATRPPAGHAAAPAPAGASPSRPLLPPPPAPTAGCARTTRPLLPSTSNRCRYNLLAIELAERAMGMEPHAAHSYICRCVGRGRLALLSENRTKVRSRRHPLLTPAWFGTHPPARAAAPLAVLGALGQGRASRAPRGGVSGWRRRVVLVGGWFLARR